MEEKLTKEKLVEVASIFSKLENAVIRYIDSEYIESTNVEGIWITSVSADGEIIFFDAFCYDVDNPIHYKIKFDDIKKYL